MKNYKFLLLSIGLYAAFSFVSPSVAYGAAWGGWGIPRKIQLNNNAIGTTSTDGLILNNSTAAANGAQQISPRIRWTGQGWKTDATAGSQTVDYIAELVPVQGAANPQARLDFNYQINGGGYQATPTISLLNGNVGIGMTGPGFPLAVQAVTGVISLESTTGTNIVYQKFVNTSGSLYIGAEGNAGSQILTGASPYSSVFATDTSNAIQFGTSNVVRMTISSGGNIGVGTNSFGTSAIKVVSIGTGTAPTTSPADVVQAYVNDINAIAGQAGLHLRDELGGVYKIGAGIMWASNAEPTCTAGIRGTVNYVAGGAGVLDTFKVCRKDAADVYAWVSLF